MIALGNGRQFFTIVIFETVQPKSIFTNHFLADGCDLYVTGKKDESFEIQLVVFGSFGRPAAFDLKAFGVV